jgi:hypothetical protein
VKPDLQTVILVLRYLFTIGGGILIAHGYLSQNALEQGLGLIPAIAPMVLGFLVQMQNKAAVKEAAATGVPVPQTTLSPLTPSPAAQDHASAPATVAAVAAVLAGGPQTKLTP